MSALLPWLAVPGVPLVLSAFTLAPATRARAAMLAPWATAPAFGLAAWMELGSTAELPALLLGTRFVLDGPSLVILLLTATLWTAAGVYARTYLARDRARARYFIFHLLTMSGNLGVAIAGDVVSFYLFFALMTFSGYGLVVHTGTEDARIAGRVYVILAVAGEAFLVSAMLLAVEAAGSLAFADLGAVAVSPRRHLILALGLAGFGVKAGAVPLHLWLPLAHPVAPTPASAVLSGAMIKAGVLGWLRFLPLGATAFPGWMTLLVALGVGGALLAAVLGSLQDEPKTVLAYSSVSQMGWMTAGLGLALGAPRAAGEATAAVVLFAAHHGMAKAALFLGTGVSGIAPPSGWRRLAVRVGLLLPAASLAGAPFTSGALAKDVLKEVGAALPWPPWAEPALALAAVGTVVLLTRFLILTWDAPGPRGRAAARGGAATALGLWLPWAALVGLSALFAAGAAPATGTPYPWLPASAAEAVSDLWPVAVGAAVAWGLWGTPLGCRLPRVPPGDVVALAGPAAAAAQRIGHAVVQFFEHTAGRPAFEAAARLLYAWRRAPFDEAEDALEPWLVIGTLFLFLAALLFLRLTAL